MKSKQSIFDIKFVFIGLLLILGCEKRDLSDLQPVTFPNTAAVFIDDFTGDLAYAAFGGSDVRAFQVDNQVGYNGTRQSMRFDVPDANSPNGSYAGGVFFSRTGRDLSGYNALTFYIKASQSATIGELGFGNDLGENKFTVTLTGLLVNSSWKKVIIPIPDASKLTAEKGLFYYATGPENNRGYSFWIDEVRFEKMNDLANLTGVILNGENRIINTAETGDKINIDGFKTVVTLPTGVNQTINVSRNYFSFASSTPTIAGVDANGLISVVDAGTTTITAKLGEKTATGSLKLTSVGAPIAPTTAAPAPPARQANDVVSMYSNAYNNVTIGTWDTNWQFSNAEQFFVKVQNDDVIRYRSLNFVGIEFTNPTINAAGMSYFHIDLWTPDPTELPNNFKIKLVDFGANGVFNGGGDDSEHEITVTKPTLVSNNWVSLDIKLSDFTGLKNRANLAQMVFSGSLPNVYVDNIYFYRNPVTPTTAAPAPTKPAANVLSIYSDTYTNVAGSDFNPNWGQSGFNTAGQITIGGNNIRAYPNFNYQGIQLGSNQNVSSYGYLHLDYYSSNATSLRVFLISPGPVETPYVLNVPTAGWNSIDIPLSAFAPVNLSDVFQLKFDGGDGGKDIFLDNIYFWKIPPVPTTAAPVPTYPAANVISIFSDSYTNVPGSDLSPFWGQNPPVIVTQTAIGGNNTLVYTGLSYQGLQFGSVQNVAGKTFLHLDYYSANATALEVFLISPGQGQAPFEKPYTLTVPTTNGWNSVDIPLSHFTPIVSLADVLQLKFVGNGNIYLDNILFR
jgi:hypothetical protein